jgi:endoglucanase
MRPKEPPSRRDFIKTAGLAAGIGVTGLAAAPGKRGNVFPRYRGFNLLDFFGARPEDDRPVTTDDDLAWMRDWGFDFVRLPMAYPRYVRFDRSREITADEICDFDLTEVERIEALVARAHRHGLHVSLNLHRAPGFCVNAGFHEPYNLWEDEAALSAFTTHWAMWAKRFKDVSSDKISFDLVNEPCSRADMNDQHSRRGPVPGPVYRKVAQAAATAIRQHNPKHLVIADGNDVGNSVVPELVDLDIVQSCRGYFPHYISHYQARWVFKDPASAPRPVWPGEIEGRHFSRQTLEEYYRPWTELVAKGVGVHCGECGCWKRTPHDVFLAWFGDVLDILTEHGIGYALWEFRGTFGIIDSERTDVAYEDWHGHRLDRKLLDLLMKH